MLGALSRQLLWLVQAADGQRLDVFLESFLTHLLHGLLHGAEKSLHTALQVVRCLLRLDDEAQALHSIGPPGPTENNVACRSGEGKKCQRSAQTGILGMHRQTAQSRFCYKIFTFQLQNTHSSLKWLQKTFYSNYHLCVEHSVWHYKNRTASKEMWFRDTVHSFHKLLNIVTLDTSGLYREVSNYRLWKAA